MLRIGAKTDEVNLAQKELDTVKALERIADEREAFDEGKNKTEGAGGGGGALMSIPLGRMKADPGRSLFPMGRCLPFRPAGQDSPALAALHLLSGDKHDNL